MKRITCIASSFPTDLKYWRGTFVENFCEALKKEGAEISVIVPDGYQNILVEWLAVKLGRRKRRQRKFPFSYAPFFSLSRLSFIFSLLGRINWYLQERGVYQALSRLPERPDVVYAHFFGNAVSASRWCKENGVPLVVVSGESSYEYFYQNLDKSRALKVISAIQHVFFVSEHNQEAFEAFFGNICRSVSILPNAVNTKQFRPRGKVQLRRALGLPVGKKIVAFLGYFIERKGPLRVLQAIENETEVSGVFIGTGSQHPTGSSVLFAGVLENSKVPEWLAACDVFVLPSLNEGRSNAIIEALACGLPVVVSDRPFNREFINEDCAVFVDPESPMAIADGIRRVLASQDVTDSMGIAARRLAEKYSLDARAETFLRVLSDAPINVK